MIELSTLLPTAPTAPGRPQLLATTGVESFAVALNALVLPAAIPGKPGQVAVEGKLPAGKPVLVRHVPADPGKILPEAADPVEGSGDRPLGDDEEGEPDTERDPVLGWLPQDAPTAPAPAAVVPVCAPAAPPPPTETTDEPEARILAAAPALVALNAAQPASVVLEMRVDPTVVVPVPEKPQADAVRTGDVRPRDVPVEQLQADAVAIPTPGAKPALGRRNPVPSTDAPDYTARQTVRAAPPAADIRQPLPAPAQASTLQPSPQGQADPVQATQQATPITAAPALDQPAALPATPGQRQPTDDQIAAALRPVILTASEAPQSVGDVRAAPAPAQTALAPIFTAPMVAPAPAQAPVMVQAAAEAAPALFQLALEPAPRRFRPADAAQLTLLASAQDTHVPQIVPLAPPSDNQQQAMLDTRRQEWTGQMIDMIEAMRDAMPVKESRIRLAPEALGNMDVSIRQDGDRVHVHIVAETPAARQLLADAQPRLAEIAEQRGVKLGQTSIEGGSAGQSSAGQGSQRQDAEARQPGRPASARSRSETQDKPTTTDERIA